MSAPDLKDAIRLLRAHCYAAIVHSPGSIPVFTCPVCHNVYATAGGSSKPLADERQIERHINWHVSDSRLRKGRARQGMSEVEKQAAERAGYHARGRRFDFWRGLETVTGWAAIPSDRDRLVIVYSEGAMPVGSPPGDALIHYRAAGWVLANRSLLRRAGVEIASREGAFLIHSSIWQFIRDLARYPTFEKDAHAIYTQAAIDQACSAAPADTSHGEEPVAPDLGRGEALPGL